MKEFLESLANPWIRVICVGCESSIQQALEYVGEAQEYLSGWEPGDPVPFGFSVHERWGVEMVTSDSVPFGEISGLGSRDVLYIDFVAPSVSEWSSGFLGAGGRRPWPDIFFGVEGEFATPYTGGIDLSIGVVIDTDQFTESGIYGTAGAAFGLSAGAALVFGVQEEVEGDSLALDANIGIPTPTVYFDPATLRPTGAALGIGKGAGIVISGTTTRTFSAMDLVDTLAPDSRPRQSYRGIAPLCR